MELLLELRYPSGATAERTDVRVEIDPDDTVAVLTGALAAHASRWGYTPSHNGAGLVRADGAQPLNPADRVVDVGLVSGETVTLADGAGWDSPLGQTIAGRFQATPAGLRMGATTLTLDVTAGPAAGRLVPLQPGDAVVGRADGCAIVIDDPLMSRQHFALHITPEGEVWVAANPNATNGTFVGGSELGEARALQPGELIQAGSSVFTVRSAASEETRRRDRMGQIPFNRVPYRPTMVCPQQLEEVTKPPDTPNARRLSVAAALMPAMTGGLMAVVMQRYLFLIIAAASPILLIYRHISNKRGGRKKFVREKAAYYERVEARAAQVNQALEHERQTRLHASPDLAELARQAMLHMPRLWERNRTAGDALDLRLGLGELPSLVSVEVARGGDEDLRNEGVGRLAYHKVVSDVPITVSVLDMGVVGLWGDPDQAAAVARSMVAQAACLQSPEDLVVVGAVGSASLPGFEWLKWLPHVRSAMSPLDGDHLVVGADAARRLMVNLLAVASERNQRASDRSGEQVWPRLLLLLDEAAEPDRALLAQLLDVAPAFGIHVLWLGASEIQVPRQCHAVVACPGLGYLGTVGFTDPALADRAVELDGTDPVTARSIARSLAPLRDASSGNQTTAIPRLVPLLDAVGIDKPAPDLITQRWSVDRGYSLQFPIGMSAEGTFELDLVEQGPHTLIGGTSGAGKSELLQTLVLSLAANYPPTKLNFLFVDYKGGASSAEFRDLPHTVGYVTNLSGRMSLRALTSLRAELQRRMTLMEGRAKDLAEMLAVAPAEAPPSLVIVVDEFAALVKEIPDFVAGIVDIAQRGRSLGVHLILATQRPTGVVNDNILANTNLRISLRMLDPTDSNNIIGSRDAADIPVPLRGRAYARTGPQALMPFQCAWSGAPFAAETQAVAVGVGRFAVGAQEGPVSAFDSIAAASSPAATLAPEEEPPTHLEVLVQACAGAARELGLPPVRRPWMEPLDEVVPLATVLQKMPQGERRADPGRVAVLGMYDDPENQAQHVSTVDLEASGGLLVFGTGGSGKTTLLRTVALDLVSQGSPDEVQLYVLDFASRALDPLADLPHCAAVVAGDDAERVARVLTVVNQEIDSRRDILAEARAESLGALRSQTGMPTVPRIVLLVDSYSGFHSMFDNAGRYVWLQLFQRIVSTGRQVGVHCVLTTERRMGVPSALLSAISSRLALRMATPEELATVGVPTKLAKDSELSDGRGFLDGATEVQVACVSDDPAGVAQSDAIAAAAAELGSRGMARAATLPELPDSVTFESSAASPSRPFTAPFGVVDLTLTVAEVDLSRQNLAIVGGPLSGKTTAMETVAWGVRASSGDAIQLFAMGSAASTLGQLGVWDDAAFSRAAHAGLVTRLGEALGDDEGIEARAMLFVDAAEDLEGNDVLRPLEALAKSDALRLVVACETTTIAKAYSGWLSGMRRNRSAILLQPESKADVDAALGVKPSLRPDQQFPPGRGIFVANRQWSLIQVGLHPR